MNSLVLFITLTK